MNLYMCMLCKFGIYIKLGLYESVHVVQPHTHEVLYIPSQPCKAPCFSQYNNLNPKQLHEKA